MPWHQRRNYPYIGPMRRVPVRPAPSYWPFFDEEEEITPVRPRQQPAAADPKDSAPAANRREEPQSETQPEPVQTEPEPAQPPVEEKPVPPQTEEPDWKEMAMRLQAEMDNFRKRQARRADEAIAAERERLLRRLLPLADNLGRALAHSQANEQSLRQGVELIYRELMRLLETEGVNRVESVGQPFDPNVHEAVASRPDEMEPDTVITEVEPGYKLGDKLLRPARVVVAA